MDVGQRDEALQGGRRHGAEILHRQAEPAGRAGCDRRLIVELAYVSRRYLGWLAGAFKGFNASLQEGLVKAGMLVPVDAYISFMLLVSGVAGALASLNAFMLGYIASRNLGFAAVVAVPAFFVAGLFAFAFTYLYPSVASGKKRRAIEEGLPFTVSFMSILSSSGIPPKRVMRSLAELERDDVGLGGESTVMYRDMEVLGDDMVTVLKKEAKKDISPILTGILDGFVTTIRSGGDLGVYFKEEARSLMRLRTSILKGFVDVLAMVAEMYMGLMVAFPLIMIVMLVVMSSIGGGTLGGVGPDTIVPLVIYGIVPGAGLVVLLMLDSLSGG